MGFPLISSSQIRVLLGCGCAAAFEYTPVYTCLYLFLTNQSVHRVKPSGSLRAKLTSLESDRSAVTAETFLTKGTGLNQE